MYAPVTVAGAHPECRRRTFCAEATLASILYITNGMASTLNASFALARRLIAAGHTVAYSSHAAIAQQVEAQGHPFFPLARDRRLAERMAADPRPPPGRPIAFAGWLRRRRALRADSIADRELENLVARLAPDLLLIDIEMHAAIIVTDGLRLPVLLPIAWFTIYRQPDLPPLHTALEPGAGSRAITLAWWRLQLASSLLRLRGRLWLPRFWRPLTWGTINIGDLAALARSRGYDLKARTDRSQWLRPHLYRNATVLSFNVREMELPHTPHPDLHYVGPMIDGGRREVLVDPEALAAWRAFRQARAATRDRRPLVYCSLGSYWSADRAFLMRVLAAFAARPDWVLVLGLGGKLAPAALAPVPDNALLLPWAPQLEVLAIADCAITHGGITTINECIASGVPMVVYSTGHVDQDGCAVRVAHHGLGIKADKERDGPTAIVDNVERVLGDPAIRERVAAMREVFERYTAEAPALRLVEAALVAEGRQERDGDRA
jgi:UDP:flavonoid glycosyltransferase YjiC (YdhE family)